MEIEAQPKLQPPRRAAVGWSAKPQGFCSPSPFSSRTLPSQGCRQGYCACEGGGGTLPAGGAPLTGTSCRQAPRHACSQDRGPMLDKACGTRHGDTARGASFRLAPCRARGAVAPMLDQTCSRCCGGTRTGGSCKQAPYHPCLQVHYGCTAHCLAGAQAQAVRQGCCHVPRPDAKAQSNELQCLPSHRVAP